MSILDKFFVLKVSGKFFRNFQSNSLELDLVDHPVEAMKFFTKEEVGRYANELLTERRQTLLDSGAIVTEIYRTPKPEHGGEGVPENQADDARPQGHEHRS